MSRAYLEITLNCKPKNRSTTTNVYAKYKEPFLTQIESAKSKKLLVRDEDVHVLHGFYSVENYLHYLHQLQKLKSI